MSIRRFRNLAQGADHLGCSRKTIYNYIGRGFFPAYKLHGKRGHFVDLDEVDAAMAKLPGRRAHAGKRAFGPKARIITVAETVDQ